MLTQVGRKKRPPIRRIAFRGMPTQVDRKKRPSIRRIAFRGMLSQVDRKKRPPIRRIAFRGSHIWSRWSRGARRLPLVFDCALLRCLSPRRGC